MYNDHKTAADRIGRTTTRPLELSRRAMIMLSLLLLAILTMAGRGDAYALAHGLI